MNISTAEYCAFPSCHSLRRGINGYRTSLGPWFVYITTSAMFSNSSQLGFRTNWHLSDLRAPFIITSLSLVSRGLATWSCWLNPHQPWPRLGWMTSVIRLDLPKIFSNSVLGHQGLMPSKNSILIAFTAYVANHQNKKILMEYLRYTFQLKIANKIFVIFGHIGSKNRTQSQNFAGHTDSWGNVRVTINFN